jgi:acyl-coenzyme A thioesterase PaaI-like protein
MGFRVEDRHTNGLRNAHGGMLMSFADMAWGHVVSVETSSYWVTVRLTVDFLASAHLGDWVEGAGVVLARDDDLFLVRGQVWTRERFLLTGVGLFKPLAAREPRPGEKAFRGVL